MFDLAMEWLNLVLRWMHLIFGIAWIGSSFFFVWLDNSLRKAADQQPGVLGQAWLIHGGGFYFTEKYSVAPPQLPAELHWFKYESYFTWLSGFFLMGALYYAGADLYLIDDKVLPLSQGEAIGISLVSLILGWVIYDLLCKSPLGKNDAALAVVGFALLVFAAWGYTQIFSARAAYLHVGALIGTIMTANVAHNIIPNQRKAVAEMLAGQVPDPTYGKQAKQRSLHNNYLTLPVLFAMISNHYPVTYGHPYGWVILAVVMVIGGLVRHFFNLKNQGRGARYEFLVVAFLLHAMGSARQGAGRGRHLRGRAEGGGGALHRLPCCPADLRRHQRSAEGRDAGNPGAAAPLRRADQSAGGAHRSHAAWQCHRDHGRRAPGAGLLDRGGREGDSVRHGCPGQARA